MRITWIVALMPAACALGAVPNFNHDVAPILFRNCSSCHRPGQVAPFSLLSYRDAAKRAGLIAAVTAKRFMPPWKAEGGHFKDERRLTDAEIKLIGDWASHGAPEGDPARKPVPPSFASGWQAGQPDLILTPPQPYPIPADGPDLFRCFVIPTSAATELYVKTVEFHPGNPRVVHHALFFLDTSGQARQLDAAEPGPGYSCFGGPQIVPAGGLGGWAPGATPQPLPAGVAQQVEKGADLVVQLHYHPSGKPETDQSSIGLTFGGPPQRGLAGMIAGSRRIDIAPGDAHYEVSDWLLVPQDAELIGIAPHAHLLCKEMKVEARFPDGTTQSLIRIPDWDFNWQGQYRYAEPVKLPKGTRIEMKYIYDNSAANPHNPSSPPRRVTFGEQTTNEMALLFLQVVLPHPEDARQFRREWILGRLERALSNPDATVGLGARAVKRLQDAIPMFDRNRNGKLDPEERALLMQLLERRLP